MREALDWVEDVVGPGSRTTSVEYLPGTSFHANHAVDVLDRDGVSHALVLRRWADAAWEELDAEFNAEREARILRLLEGSSVPTPVLVAADPLGRRCGVPALLATRLPGRPPDEDPADRPGFLRELARIAAVISSIDGPAARSLPAYRRYVEPASLTVPSWTKRPELWERAIAIAREPAPPGRESFIHRDLHPGNTLWQDGAICGVVDWSYGSWGPAAVDTAHLRWNLAVDLGPAAADQLLDEGELDRDRYWDLVDVLDLLGEPGIGPPEEPALERFEEYVAGLL
jgi:aminoglycoside phosphotransferase (APT) family kinase protein